MKMNFTAITSEVINLINADVKAALLEIENKYNVKFQMGNSRYDSSHYKTNFEVKLLGESGATKISEQLLITTNLYADCQVNFNSGVNGNFIGSSWNHPIHGNFKVVDYNTRKRKYPIVFQLESGVKKICNFEFIKQSKLIK